MQPYIDTCLIVLSLIMVNTSAAVYIFYRPKDLLPHTYDTLKWVAFVSGMIGVFILANYVTAICCFILSLAYPLVYKQCYADIDSPQGFGEIGMESAAVSVLAWALSFALRPIPFSASVLVLALTVYFICRVYSGYYRAEALRDTDKKQRFIDGFTPLVYPLAQLLCRYHPDWYPPPVNRILTASIAKYATVLRDLDKMNGNQFRDMSDDEVLRSSYMVLRFRFPDSWDYEKTSDFCYPLFDIAETLRLCAELPLAMQAKYEAEIMHIFDQDHLLPELQTAINPILEKQDFSQPESEIAYTEARLIALIPDYIAATKCVIGTPLDDLPVAYDSLASRYRHTFLIGSSGAGKSTVITNLVTQDMHKGCGVIVISPDQKLFRDLVPYIPENRLDDVIYFDPNDTTFPIIGFNPFFFETPANLKPQDREYKTLRDNRVQETYAVLERTLEIKTEPTQRLLNNALYALTGRPNTTFRDLSRLIDPKERPFHQEIANDSRVDNETQKFWANYATESANAMVYRTLSDRIMPLLRSSLSEVFSTQSFSFHRELNERARIFLIDISTFGSRTSREAKIAAQLLIPTIHQTLFRRNSIDESDYIPYFMYVDEFQNFANTNEETINDMAEQTRKFHVGLTLTSLVASDLTPKLLDTINGVMRTKICLNLSAKDARLFASELLIKRGGRDSYDAEALQTLGIGEAYVKTPPNTSAVFVKLPKEPVGNAPTVSITFEQLKRRSKANFGALARSQESLVVDQDIVPEDLEETPYTPLAPEPPQRREPPKKTPSQPLRSKTPHQTPVSDSPTIDPKTQPQAEAELFDTPPAPAPQAPNAPPKKAPPRPTKRKKRNRFDEDVGEAEIEVF